LPEQNRFDQADKSCLYAVAEVHVPVAAQRAAETKLVRFHRRYHRHFRVTMSRFGAQKKRGVTEKLK